MSFNYNLPIKINFPNISFRSNPVFNAKPQNKSIQDGFVSNPIYDNFGTKAEIEAAAKANARICEIMQEHNLPIQVNIEELEKLKQGHLKDTRIIAAQMYSALPAELKQEISLYDIQTAALMNAYRKVLIPSSILNKAGKLTPEEREIMELHSELGYELLKDKGLNERTLNLIKYHHQNLNGNGYPSIHSNFKYGVDAQILSTADKYTALREQRSYKNPLGKYEALEIIAKDVNNGHISQEVYTSLIKGV